MVKRTVRKRKERKDMQFCSKDKQWVGHCLGGKWKRKRLGEKEEKELQKKRGREGEKAEIEEWFLMPMIWSLYEDIFSEGRQHSTPLS